MNAATEHRIWARQHMDEYLGVWTTWVYQEFSYLEDTTLNAVWSPQEYQWYCADDGVGWTITNCYRGTVSSGDAHVERYTHGEFSNSCCGGINHSLQANPWAEVGVSYQACYFAGTWPAGWHGPVCEGGRAY